MTGRHATHCRHGHDIAVCGRDTSGHCRECGRARNLRRSCTGRPRASRKWTAIETALRAAWEGTSEPSQALAVRFGLPSKNAVIGLAYRARWKPRSVPPPRTMADRLDALARAFEAAVLEASP